jgi:hypothetical protein
MMIFLVLSRNGYNALLTLIGHAPSPMWINRDVLSKSELDALRQNGVQVTNFTHLIDPASAQAVEDALDIVREHHPDELIWAEHGPIISQSRPSDT